MLSFCISSCSKKDDVVIPLIKEDIVGNWTISESPVISVVIGGHAFESQKVSDTLEYLFKSSDKYNFNADLSCTVNRGSTTAPYPKTYKVENGYLIFDGYIKFLTNVSSDNKKLTLTAGMEEVREIVRQQVNWADLDIAESDISSALRTVTGSLRLVFDKE
jgi:hypothetical protein